MRLLTQISRRYATFYAVPISFSLQYKCCGLVDYEDFETALKWEREYTVDGTKLKLPIPLACCRVNDDFPRGIPDDVMCTSEPNLKNSFQDVVSLFIYLFIKTYLYRVAHSE